MCEDVNDKRGVKWFHFVFSFHLMNPILLVMLNDEPKWSFAISNACFS